MGRARRSARRSRIQARASSDGPVRDLGSVGFRDTGGEEEPVDLAYVQVRKRSRSATGKPDISAITTAGSGCARSATSSIRPDARWGAR